MIPPDVFSIEPWAVTEPELRLDLPAHTGVPVHAVIPDGAGALDPESFRAAAPCWFLSPPAGPG